MGTSDYIRYRLTRHAISRVEERGFTVDAVRHVLLHPELDYPVSRHTRKNQRRLCGRDLVVIVDGDSQCIPTVIPRTPAPDGGTPAEIDAAAGNASDDIVSADIAPDEPAKPAPAPASKPAAESVRSGAVPPTGCDTGDVGGIGEIGESEIGEGIVGDGDAVDQVAECGSPESSAPVEKHAGNVPTIEPLTVLEAPVSEVTADQLTVDLGEFGDGLVGVISRNNVALNAGDRNTAKFKVGDMVWAMAISEKDGVVKLSIRKLQQQQRDMEAASAQKAEMAMMTALQLQEEKRRRNEKRQRDIEAASAAAQRRQEETERRRAKKTACLKRYGAVAAIGIAATFAGALLIAKWNRPADTDMLNPKDALVSYNDSDSDDKENKDGENAQGENMTQEDTADSLIKYLKAHGVNVQESRIGVGVIGQSRIPPNTIRVYKLPKGDSSRAPVLDQAATPDSSAAADERRSGDKPPAISPPPQP
ncbi:MAG: hypothetical protein LBT74_13655 [Acidobacteriota bacterium]|jgi:hypothetical protein|nr:hypothetical protein [Acidobacteriota bacterium]